MTQTADIIIIGGGVIGCSTAYNLAKQGAKNVTLLERGAICSGGTAKSCAIVRTHYSIESNLIHAVESLKIFANFAEIIGGNCDWHQTGYLILGPEEHRQPMQTVFDRQNDHGIDTRILSPAEARQIHPLLQLDDVGIIGYDTQTGYADPYLTTTSYADRARALGVTICREALVTHIQQKGMRFRVQTPTQLFESPQLVLAAGPWTNDLAHMLGLNFPYEISRHKVITLKIEQPYQALWPIVKDLTTPDKLYFRPETGDMVLIGTGDHGDPIDDADTLTDEVDFEHVSRIEALISRRMPAFTEAQFVAGWTGPYDITPDWNPVVGSVADVEGLYVAVGFSGHGFKLAPTIGESLASVVLGQKPRLPIEPYSLDRFGRGKALHSAYGIGSIS